MMAEVRRWGLYRIVLRCDGEGTAPQVAQVWTQSGIFFFFKYNSINHSYSPFPHMCVHIFFTDAGQKKGWPKKHLLIFVRSRGGSASGYSCLFSRIFPVLASVLYRPDPSLGNSGLRSAVASKVLKSALLSLEGRLSGSWENISASNPVWLRECFSPASWPSRLDRK